MLWRHSRFVWTTLPRLRAHLTATVMGLYRAVVRLPWCSKIMIML